MFEKYDVTRVGVPGDGGEYTVQEGTRAVTLRGARSGARAECIDNSVFLRVCVCVFVAGTGFGWTNGVVLRFAIDLAASARLEPCAGVTPAPTAA